MLRQTARPLTSGNVGGGLARSWMHIGLIPPSRVVSGGETGRLGQGLEIPSGVLGPKRAAILAREGQTCVVPCRAPCDTFHLLRFIVLLQRGDGVVVDRDESRRAFGLRGADDQTARAPQ